MFSLSISHYPTLASLRIGRNEATALGQHFQKPVGLFLVLNRPKVILSEPRALSGSKPRASNTCEGWPAWMALHALPDETAMPCLSSSNSSLIASPSRPSKPRQTWPGRRR